MIAITNANSYRNIYIILNISMDGGYIARKYNLIIIINIKLDCFKLRLIEFSQVVLSDNLYI